MALPSVLTLMRGLPLAGTLAVVCILPLLIGLGMWQLERAEFRETLRDNREQRMADTPVRLHGGELDSDGLRWRRAELRGRYESDHTVLLDNRVRRGQPGYHVFTPFVLDGSETRVLINRGWVPWGGSRAELPPTTPPGEAFALSGLLDLPPEPGLVLGREEAAEGWPSVWQSLDLARYRASVPFPVHPVVLILDENEPGGFVRDFDPGYNDGWIVRHQAYAFQWFALAATLVALYAWAIIRRRRAASRDCQSK